MLESHVSTFLNIISMTRKMKFLNWSAGTVDKAFGWAEAVHNYHEVPLEYVSDLHIPAMKNVIFLDVDLIDVLRDPAFLILKAIFTSPLLSWCRNKLQIVSQCLLKYHSTYTIDRAVYDSVTILKSYICQRVVERRARGDCSHEEIAAKEGLAGELIYAIAYSVTVDSVGGLVFDEDMLSNIHEKVREDSAFAEVFAIGLLLSPGQIMCAPCVISSEIEVEHVINVSASPVLWEVLETYASEEVGKFIMSIEPSTLSRLIKCSNTLKIATLSIPKT